MLYLVPNICMTGPAMLSTKRAWTRQSFTSSCSSCSYLNFQICRLRNNKKYLWSTKIFPQLVNSLPFLGFNGLQSFEDAFIIDDEGINCPGRLIASDRFSYTARLLLHMRPILIERLRVPAPAELIAKELVPAFLDKTQRLGLLLNLWA